MKSISITRHLWIVVCFSIAVMGCGGGRAFQPQFRDIQEPERSQVIDALNTIETPEVRSVITGIDENGQLYAWDFKAGEMLWSRPVEAKSMPIVVGDLILIQEEKGPLARRLQDGEKAFSLDSDARIVGGHSDGKYTAISIELGPEGNPRGYLVGVENNAKIWMNDLTLPVGIPAVVNGIVVVPWASQRISLLDAATGEEKTRFQLSDAVVGSVFVDNNVVYMGQNGIMQVSRAIEDGRKEKLGYYEPMPRKLPAQPPFLRDGYLPLPLPDDNSHHIRVVWQPKLEKGQVGLRNNTMYYVFHKLVFALHPSKDQLKWIYRSPTTIVGAEAQDELLLLATSDGKLSALDAKTGVPGWKAEMNMPIKTAFFRTGTYLPKTKAKKADQSLREQITDLIENGENTLATGIAFAVPFLKDLKPPEITGQLVDICSSPQKPLIVRTEACKTLETRTNGAKYVTAALKKRGSFLKGTPAPPSGSLALAAANMKLKTSVNDILYHLGDPATPSSDLKGIFEALGKLGTRSTASTIEDFLLLYHAETKDAALITSLGAASHALVALKGKGAKAVLEPMANDPLTAGDLSRETLSALEPIGAPPEEKEKEKETPATEVASAPTPKETVVHSITGKIVQDVMAPLKTDLKACIPKDFRKTKIVLLVHPAGKIQSVFTTPDTAQKCVRKTLKKVRFPKTRKDDSEQIIYIVKR